MKTKNKDQINITDFKIKLLDKPAVDISFLAKDQMDMDVSYFDSITLRYYGIVIDIKGAKVKKQGHYSGGDGGPAPWTLRCYDIHIDNNVGKEELKRIAEQF